MGDERRLKQVLINLVKNAFKFTKEGYIQIQACYNKEESMLIVYVIDTGAGIAEEDFPKMFTRFGKLHRTAQQNNEGIGLGLMIVKQIVEASGGDICFHSDGPGLGSTFCFSMIQTEVQEENSRHYREIETNEENIQIESMRVIQGSHVDWKCLDRTPHASQMDDSKMKDSVDTPT